MVSQNVLNVVDTAMVGVLGDEALAAVGMGGFLNFLLSSFILGLGAGVQAMSSRRVGEGRNTQSAVPLNGGLLVGVAVAIPWSILVFLAVPALFPRFVDDAAVAAAGAPYLQARVLAMAAVTSNFAFRGFWNATDRSRLYLGTIVVMHAVNIALNWVLIFGKLGFPALGATGAGVASAIATYVGTAVYFYLGWRHARGNGFLRALPDLATVRGMLKLSLPASVQQSFFSGGMVAFYWIVGQIGTAELAATNVMITLLLLALLPGLGFGLASMSLVGQALGRGDPSDARRWGWEVAAIAFVVAALIALPSVVAPDLPLRFFLHDPETLAMASVPMRLVAIFLCVDATGMVLMSSLQGAGATGRVMLASVALQWLLFLPIAYAAGPVMGLGLTTVWALNIGYRQIQAVVFALMWRGKSWMRIRV